MTDTPPPAPQTPFHDLDAYVALPRASGLALSPDGTRLVTSVSTLDPKKTRYVTALWEIDPAGERPARRLTRSAKGESGAAFLPDGSVLFTSARPDPDAEPDDDAPAALWLLPAGGGEARVVATRPGGVGGIVVAREAGTLAVTSDTLPSSVDGEDDEKRRKARKEAGTSGILHSSYPVRYWDHDLGPDAPRLLVGSLDTTTAEAKVTLRELTGHVGRVLDEVSYDITPDGATLVTAWQVPERGGRRYALMAIDTRTAERRTLLDGGEELEWENPVVSPSGTHVAVLRGTRSTPTHAPSLTLAVVELASGDVREVTSGWDRWPNGYRWTPDGSALVVTADEDGRGPVFRVDASTGDVVRLTADDAAYSDVQVSPDGAHVYAMRSSYLAPAHPVRLAATEPDQTPTALPAPAPTPVLPGTLTEVRTSAADGTPLRAWLALPAGTSAAKPAPLLLWIHGGPLGSWNAWSWRWAPWLMVARGYAVLLPDPALSTGYGLAMVQRSWGSWGSACYDDLMRMTDAALERDDLDAGRTAAMGGSFGGYMSNWVAGHTDRFRAIVTHASLWALDQFGPTTDAAHYWRRELTPEMERENSPHLHVDTITSPMLVIHGDRDYRVPIGEGLRLFAELTQRYGDDDGTGPHRFLYFPDENHWVLKPGNAKVWYAAVLAFLGQHVLGEDELVPELLR